MPEEAFCLELPENSSMVQRVCSAVFSALKMDGVVLKLQVYWIGLLRNLARWGECQVKRRFLQTSTAEKASGGGSGKRAAASTRSPKRA